MPPGQQHMPPGQHGMPGSGMGNMAHQGPNSPHTPPPPCPNTTPPTRHTRPIQAPTPHTLTPPLTSLRAGKTLISTSLKTSRPQQLSPRMLQTIKNYSIYSLSSKVCYYDQ